MPTRTSFAALLAASLLALPAWASDSLMIQDAYARAASPKAMAGGSFMVIMNPTQTDDRLIAAASDAAARVELHTHIEDANGVMRMVEVEDGFEIPAGGQTELRRGGLHVMLMGLTRPLVQGETIDLTLTFENAGDMVVTVPIDNERMDMDGHGRQGN